jgi:phosphogluconate dehydratase
VPAAIHVSPEGVRGGGIARVRDGDPIVLDAERGTLSARVPEAAWAARTTARADLAGHRLGMGRELFGVLRASSTTPEEGALTYGFLDLETPAIEPPAADSRKVVTPQDAEA